MTKEERAAARARCEAATPGAWEALALGVRAGPFRQVLSAPTLPPSEADYGRMQANLDFAAHARADLPAALDALDAADRRIEELEALTRSLSERVAKQSEMLSRRAKVQEPSE